MREHSLTVEFTKQQRELLEAGRSGRLVVSANQRIICVSYSNELAVKHANDFRAVVNSAWYRRIFPDTRSVGRRIPNMRP
jgi:hypothetical protein